MTDFDLTKAPAGSLTPRRFDGEPVDALRHAMLSRAGVPINSPLRADIVHYRLGDTDPTCDRLPSPFPPEGTEPQDIQSVAQVLALADKVKISAKDTMTVAVGAGNVAYKNKPDKA